MNSNFMSCRLGKKTVAVSSLCVEAILKVPRHYKRFRVILKTADPLLMYAILTALSLISLGIVLLIQWISPKAIPFGTFEFWKTKHFLEGITSSWPIFLWGSGVTIIFSAFTKNSRRENAEAEAYLEQGVVQSILAGLLEEVYFRWIALLLGIAAAKLSNFLFFGWLGFGVTQWVQVHIAGPLVNLVTFGKMKWLVTDMGWAIGAGALAANAKFRKGHRYLGPFGLVNSWIIGFFLFWIMFNYGLVTSMTVHFLYDVFITVIRYFDMYLERKHAEREERRRSESRNRIRLTIESLKSPRTRNKLHV